MDEQPASIEDTTSNYDAAAAAASCNTCWILGDGLVTVVILLGNVLTILAVRLSRRLRSVASNQLVLSLAVSDFVVGLAVLYHMLFYIDNGLNTHKTTCILRFILLFGGCCASFCNVTAIAVDRYLAIVHPLNYPEYVTQRLVYLVIGSNWTVSLFISTIPAYWNTYGKSNSCELDTVIPSFYTVAILAPLFIIVWLSILVLYWRIWKEAKTHAERWKQHGFINFDSSHRKSNQVVLLILGCFTICWLPYVIVALSQVVNSREKTRPTIYRIMFTIAMSNSGVNPMIYAWKNPSFRKAFYRLLRLRTPNYNDYNSSFKNYQRKQIELRKKEDEEKKPAFVIKDSHNTELIRQQTVL